MFFVLSSLTAATKQFCKSYKSLYHLYSSILVIYMLLPVSALSALS